MKGTIKGAAAGFAAGAAMGMVGGLMLKKKPKMNRAIDRKNAANEPEKYLIDTELTAATTSDGIFGIIPLVSKPLNIAGASVGIATENRYGKKPPTTGRKKPKPGSGEPIFESVLITGYESLKSIISINAPIRTITHVTVNGKTPPAAL